MSLFTIDEEKCTRCGTCIDDCPVQVIESASNEAVPSMVSGAELRCLKCGHCVAICPEGAFALDSMRPDECDAVPRDMLPGEVSVREMLRSRRSIRMFRDRSVSREVLADLVEVSRYAPTASNKQQVRWTVFDDAGKIRDLSAQVIDWMRLIFEIVLDKDLAERMKRVIDAWDEGKDRVLRDAPGLIIVHTQADLPFAETDCIIALTYLELYAASKGLGTCWAGYLTKAAGFHEPLMKSIHLPQGDKFFGAVMVGYPKYDYIRIPGRNKAVIEWV